MKSPTCVICRSRKAMRTLPDNGIMFVELLARCYGDYYFEFTHVVCASCAASNIDEVFDDHVSSVLQVINGKGKKR